MSHNILTQKDFMPTLLTLLISMAIPAQALTLNNPVTLFTCSSGMQYQKSLSIFECGGCASYEGLLKNGAGAVVAELVDKPDTSDRAMARPQITTQDSGSEGFFFSIGSYKFRFDPREKIPSKTSRALSPKPAEESA